MLIFECFITKLFTNSKLLDLIAPFTIHLHTLDASVISEWHRKNLILNLKRLYHLNRHLLFAIPKSSDSTVFFRIFRIPTTYFVRID